MPYPTTPPLTRRGLLAGGAGLAAALGLAACGSSDSGSGSGSASAAPSGGASGAAGGGTRKVTTAYGEVEVPAQPQRVVAASWNTPFQLMAVGLTPVGAMDYSTFHQELPPEAPAFLSKVATIGQPGALSIEKIAALQPDLIVGDPFEVDQSVYKKLSDIAPTAIVKSKNTGDWEFISSSIAEYVGRADALAEAKKKYVESRDRVKAKYADLIKKNTWISYSFGGRGQDFSIQLPGGEAGSFLEGLGIPFAQAVAAAAKDHEGWAGFSLEQLPTLKDATVGLHPLGSDGKDFEGIAKLHKSPLYSALPFVKSKKDFALIYMYMLTDYGTAARAVEEIETKVFAKL